MPFSRRRHLPDSDGASPDLLQEQSPMSLNNQQRTGVANLLGDMAVAIILGLTIAIFMGGVITWWLAASMCIFSLLLAVASVYLRSPPDTQK
jgi:predicted MFS family arabinose efflux permease